MIPFVVSAKFVHASGGRPARDFDFMTEAARYCFRFFPPFLRGFNHPFDLANFLSPFLRFFGVLGDLIEAITAFFVIGIQVSPRSSLILVRIAMSIRFA